MKSLQIIMTIVLISFFTLEGCNQYHTGKEKMTQERTDITSKNQSRETEVVLNDSLKKVLIQKGGEIASITATTLKKHLKAAMKAGDLSEAVRFCHNKAMELTDSISKAESVTVRRLAKKYRNPLNETNAAESDILKAYLLKWLGGKPLKPEIIPDNEGHPVFYYPIYISNACLKCHGIPGKDVAPELEKTIRELYPGDKATGFKKGWLRGMWAITFPEYKVK